MLVVGGLAIQSPDSLVTLQSMRLNATVSLLYCIDGLRGLGRQKREDAFVMCNWN